MRRKWSEEKWTKTLKVNSFSWSKRYHLCQAMNWNVIFLLKSKLEHSRNERKNFRSWVKKVYDKSFILNNKNMKHQRSTCPTSSFVSLSNIFKAVACLCFHFCVAQHWPIKMKIHRLYIWFRKMKTNPMNSKQIIYYWSMVTLWTLNNIKS